MSDWLENLPIAGMALVVFAATYLVAGGIYRVVIIEERALASDRGRAPPITGSARAQGLVAASYRKVNRDAYEVEHQRRVRSKGGPR